jgi:RNA chaperone Hfq
MAGYLVRSAHRPTRAVPPEPPAAEPAPAAAEAAGHRVEVQALDGWRRSRAALEVHCFDGLTVVGALRAFDRYSLLLSTRDGDVMLYKHAVLRIRPQLARRAVMVSGGRAVTTPLEEEPPAPD